MPNDEIVALFSGFVKSVASNTMDDIADYVVRGRPLQHLTNAELDSIFTDGALSEFKSNTAFRRHFTDALSEQKLRDPQAAKAKAKRLAPQIVEEFRQAIQEVLSDPVSREAFKRICKNAIETSKPRSRSN